MTKYLLPQVGKVFRANLHSHTNISDGSPTPEEMKEYYKSRGYSILSITDHNIIADHSYLNDEDFLTITGAEYNINQEDWANKRLWCKTYHLNFIAKRPDNLWQPFVLPAKESAQPYLDKVENGGITRVYSVEAINAMIAEANRRGFMVMYNHPSWSLQDYTDYAGLEGVWSMEIANGDCIKAGYGDRDNSRVLTDMLNLGKRVFPVGGDDSHAPSHVGKAWTMIAAEKLEYGSVIEALEKGDLYASTGPEIHELSITDGVLTVKCSDAQAISLESGIRFAKRAVPKEPDKLIRKATFDLNKILEQCTGEDPREWFRITVFDPYGNYAASRAYTYHELV